MNAGANEAETCQVLESVDFISNDGLLHVLENKNLSFAYRTSPFQQMKGAIVGATFRLQASATARKYQVGLVRIRSKSQPYSAMSAGCVFVNPPGLHAGALIEKSGLKGLSVGAAQVSPVHANFLVNTGKATCEEMLHLMMFVKQRVKAQFGVELKSEVRCIPYELGN
jgi:UDP-N-acetylmuramate dehydrogenase